MASFPIRIALASAILPLAFGVGCKRSGSGDASEVLFDSNVAQIVDFTKLTREEQIDVCKRSLMVTFVGNAEEVDIETVSGSRPPAETDAEKRVDLSAVIKKQFDDLRQSLGDNNCGPFAQSATDKSKLPPVLLATIFDGPGHGDSEINTTWYRWNASGTRFEREATQSWTYADGKLKRAEAGARFELHLPTMLSGIAKELFEMRSGGFDQTMYFFKSHGGRLVTDKNGGTPVGASLSYAIKGQPEVEGWERTAKHLFLFDPNGEAAGKKLDTDPAIYAAYWNKTSACELLQDAPGIAKEKMQESEACAVCGFEGCKVDAEGNVLGSSSSGSSTLGSSSSGSSTLGSSSSGSSTLGSSSSGSSTLGSSSSGSSTLGSSSSGSSTLGSSSSGSSTLGSSSSGSSTLGSSSSGSSTLGSSSSGSSTLGSSSAGSSTLAAVGEGSATLGGGKGFLFLAKPTIESQASLTNPDGAKRIASAASYDLAANEIKGVAKLILPGGNDAEAATFMVLDSCYGDESLARAVKTRGTKPARVVVVTNPSPMLADVFNYGALNVTKYVAFTAVNYWYEEYKTKGTLASHEPIKVMKERLDEYLSQQGLIDVPAMSRALAKAKAEGRELTDEEKRATFRPRQLRSLRVATTVTDGE